LANKPFLWQGFIAKCQKSKISEHAQELSVLDNSVPEFLGWANALKKDFH